MENKKNVTVQMTEEFYNKVIVDVPQEGGGGGSTWIYFDTSKMSDRSVVWNLAPFIVKIENIIGPPNPQTDWTQVNAVAIDDGFKLYYNSVLGLVTWSQVMAEEGLTPEVMAQIGLTEITEEEFYNLESKPTIEFTIDGTTYQAEEGMTWQEFVDSSYNDGAFSINTAANYVVHNGQYLQYPIDEDGMHTSSRPTDVIVAGTNYSYMEV